MKLIDKDTLVAEIEKLKGQLLRGACSSQISMQARCKEESYDEVLALLDTIQEESVSEDLAKAAKDFSNNLDNICGSIGEQIRNAFKAGANWQKQQTIDKAAEWIKENAADYIAHHWNETELDTMSLIEDFKEYLKK